jgi:molybdopterin molybdotransferase
MPLFGRKKSEESMPPRERWAPLPPAPEPGAGGLRSMEDHRDYLLSCLTELPPFRQQILDALDLSICEDVYSSIDMPRFDNSAMDGYAVRAVDVADASPEHPVSLPVVGEVAAGQDALYPLSPGTAIKIMTGAPLPPVADAIVPYENTDRGSMIIGIRSSPIRPKP